MSANDTIIFNGGKLSLLTAGVKGQSLSKGAIAESRFCVGWAATSKGRAVNVLDILLPTIRALVARREEYLKEGKKSARDNAKELAKRIREGVRFIRQYNPKSAMGAAFAALELQAAFPSLKVNGRISAYKAMWDDERQKAVEAQAQKDSAEIEARRLVEMGIADSMETALSMIAA